MCLLSKYLFPSILAPTEHTSLSPPETFEKCSILFKFKEGDPATMGFTTPEECASHSMGQAGMH